MEVSGYRIWGGEGAINFVLFLWWLFLCVVFPIKFIAKHVDLSTIYKPRILVTDDLTCSSIGCLLNIKSTGLCLNVLPISKHSSL